MKKKLKPQSAKNEEQCWGELIEHVRIYPNVVLVDATKGGDGSLDYCIYASDDDPLLNALTVTY